jgi:hypothetical protein
MKRIKIYVFLIALSFTMIGCTAKEENKVKAQEPIKQEQTDKNRDSNEEDIQKLVEVDGLDFSEVAYLKSETERDEKLEAAFAKELDLKKGEDMIRYYYNRIDLNGDEKPETFVLLVGPMVCGSGGCSALIFKSDQDTYQLQSRFTLVNNPIVVSETKTDGWNDLIMYVVGGGVEPFYAEIKYDGKQYPSNPSVQPKVKEGPHIKGTAIVADDLVKSPGIEF